MQLRTYLAVCEGGRRGRKTPRRRRGPLLLILSSLKKGPRPGSLARPRTHPHSLPEPSTHGTPSERVSSVGPGPIAGALRRNKMRTPPCGAPAFAVLSSAHPTHTRPFLSPRPHRPDHLKAFLLPHSRVSARACAVSFQELNRNARLCRRRARRRSALRPRGRCAGRLGQLCRRQQPGLLPEPD